MEQRRSGRPQNGTVPAHRRRSWAWRDAQRRGADLEENGQRLGSQGMNEGMRLLSMLIAGCLCYGLVGWGADRVLGTSVLMPVGIVVGLGLAVFMVTRRYGASGTDPSSGEDGSSR